MEIDRAWNIRMTTEAFERFGAMLGADWWERIGGATRNIMRLFFPPQRIRPHVMNWSAIAPLLWLRARQEAEGLGADDTRTVLDDVRRSRIPRR